MSARLRTRNYSAVVIVLTSLLTTEALAQGTLKGNRDLMHGIAQGVHDIVKKNFYDPSIKGIDWNKELQDTQTKIDNSNSPGEMLAAIYWMVRKIDDSHTNFVPPLQTLEPRFGFQAKPFGDTVLVFRIKEKGPAERSGLLVGDTLLGIEGVAANRQNYFQTQYYYRFIQPAGILVLDIQRDGKRQRIEIPADVHTRQALDAVYDYSKVYDAIREEETNYSENPFQYASADNIGYVKLRNFVGDLAEKTLWKVKGSRALIIDLRGNPGGQIEDLQRFAGYLESSEVELYTEVGREKTQKIMAKPRQPSFSDVPMVVLVDSESASSSEMLARHLQLAGRAIIMGDRTAGHVAVARMFRQHIGNEAAVFYGAQTTVGRVTFSDGKDLEGMGVTPDVMCIPEAADLVAKKDPCKALAFATLKTKLGANTALK